jgi:hypothetical protein
VDAAWTLEADRLRLRITFPSGVWPWERRRARWIAADLRWSPLTAIDLVLLGDYYPLEGEQAIVEAMDLPLPLLATFAAASEGLEIREPHVRALRGELLAILKVPESLALKHIEYIG